MFIVLDVFVVPKMENELCSLKIMNCEKDLRCIKEPNGCDAPNAAIGRCRKGILK